MSDKAEVSVVREFLAEFPNHGFTQTTFNLALSINSDFNAQFNFVANHEWSNLHGETLDVLLNCSGGLPIQCHIVSTTINSQGNVEGVLFPRFQPVRISTLAGTIRLTGLLLCMPELLLPVSTIDNIRRERHVLLRSTKYSVAIKSLGRKAFVGKDGVKGTIKPTHRFVMKFNSVEADEVFYNKCINEFLDFLSFVRASRVGTMNLIGHSKDAIESFWEYGSTKADQFGHKSSWFDAHLTNQLASVFAVFSDYYSHSSQVKFLRRTISYYCLGNSLRSTALEPALVMSVTALENIAAKTLGQSEFKKLKQKSLGDVLQRTFARLGLNEDPTIFSSDLTALIAAQNCSSGFHAIVKIRNEVTHSFPKIAGDLPVHDALVVSQWLVETALLHLIGYKGKYSDRRTAKWVGEHKSVSY